MDLRRIPRAAVGGYIKAVRWPVDRTTKVLRGGDGAEVAVDRAEATARAAAGTVLGDEELKRDAAQRSRAADEREHADTLHGAAEARASIAEQELTEREAEAERRRERAAQRADTRREKAAETAKAQEKAAGKAATSRKKAAAKTQAAQEEKIASDAKRERLAALEAEKAALDREQAAVTASDEAQRLAAAAEEAKARRKGS